MGRCIVAATVSACHNCGDLSWDNLSLSVVPLEAVLYQLPQAAVSAYNRLG